MPEQEAALFFDIETFVILHLAILMLIPYMSGVRSDLRAIYRIGSLDS